MGHLCGKRTLNTSTKSLDISRVMLEDFGKAAQITEGSLQL